MNNRLDDITDEPRPRRLCKACGQVAHSPERCLPREISEESLARLTRA